MSAFTMIRGFWQNDRGSISTISVFALLLIIVMAGGAVDVSILYKDKAYTSDMADNAVLAAASEFKRARSGRTGRQAANELVSTTATNSFGEQEYIVQTSYEKISTKQFKVTTSVSGTTKHFFLGLIGQNETKVSSSSTSILNLVEAEVILVLDVSASMLDGTLFEDMKTAAKNFVEELDPYEGDESYISFTIIPFSGTVNMGEAADIWLHPSDGLDYTTDFTGCFRDMDGRSVGALQAYPFYEFLHSSRGIDVSYCPPAGSAALLNGSDKDAITAHIDGLEVGLGTGSDVGLLWAERMLTESWRDRATFASTPYNTLNPYTQKFVVFLTDGELTRNDEDQNGVKGLQNSDDIPTYSTDVETSFVNKCEDLRADTTISVFTVGYSETGYIDQGLTDLLVNCTSGSGQYYSAASANVDDIFSSIRAEIQDVYLLD